MSSIPTHRTSNIEEQKRGEPKTGEPKREASFGEVGAGWTHALLVAPLSPRTRRALSESFQELGLEDLELLPPQSLSLTVLDLGLCHRDALNTLRRSVERAIGSHPAFKLSSSQLHLTPISAPQMQGRTLVTLELRDRYHQLSALQEDLWSQLARFGFEPPYQEEPADRSEGERRARRGSPERERSHERERSREREQKKTLSPHTLLGSAKGSKYKHFDLSLRSSLWVNELILLTRPHEYHPLRGYERAWEVKLPTERTSLPSSGSSAEEDEPRQQALTSRLEQRLQERAEAYQERAQRPQPKASSAKSNTSKRRRRRGQSPPS